MNKKTIKLYDEYPYDLTFEGGVLSCEPSKKEGLFEIVLDQTLFFPEEGGQTPDKGTISCANVLDVQIKEDIIYHIVDKEIPVGEKVSGKIDWNHRFSNMQQHTGEHIFSGIVHERFGYENVGFHLSDNIVTMDYSGKLTAKEIAEVEMAVNEAIFKNVDVIAWYPDKDELQEIQYRSKKELEGPIRIVKIPGYDMCACCAPHVKKTGEIGILKVISSQNYKGGTRVSILCGKRALEFLTREHDMINDLALSLSTSWENIPDVLSKQKDEIAQLKRAMSDSMEKLLEQQCDDLSDELASVCIFADENTDSNVARRIVNKLVSERNGYCGCFMGNDENGYRFIIGINEGNANELLGIMREKMEVRGGGAPKMVQGTANGRKSDIEEIFRRLF